MSYLSYYSSADFRLQPNANDACSSIDEPRQQTFEGPLPVVEEGPVDDIDEWSRNNTDDNGLTGHSIEDAAGASNHLEHDFDQVDSDSDPPPQYESDELEYEPPSLSNVPKIEACCCRQAHPGCCRKHNSTRHCKPLFQSNQGSHQNLLSTWLKKFWHGWHTENVESGSKSRESPYTITPIHPMVSYHLAHDNLRCILRRVGPQKGEVVFIPDLSCEESATSTYGTRYNWSNEVYHSNSNFLQKQRVDCYIRRGAKNAPVEQFTCCPHHRVLVYKPIFLKKGGLIEVQTRVAFKANARPFDPIVVTWSSSLGLYAEIVTCTICHSDAECVLRQEGDSLHIRFAAYRNLGPGTTPRHMMWHPLLTGDGHHCRTDRRADVFSKVWGSVLWLRRPDPSMATYSTTSGPFPVESPEWPADRG
jgi:hypothetical protein